MRAKHQEIVKFLNAILDKLGPKWESDELYDRLPNIKVSRVWHEFGR